MYSSGSEYPCVPKYQISVKIKQIYSTQEGNWYYVHFTFCILQGQNGEENLLKNGWECLCFFYKIPFLCCNILINIYKNRVFFKALSLLI